MFIRRRQIIIIPIAIILAAALFFGGFFVGKKSVPSPTVSERIFFNRELGKPEPIDFGLFWQALKAIEKKYVDSTKIDYKEILYGAIEGMVDSLGDDYTIFMRPEKAEEFIKSVSGKDSFEGVGMEIGIKNKVLTVIAPIEGTPAYRAGIRAGDKILKIDERLTDGMSSEQAVNLIRGKKGTQVVLTISRKEFSEPREFTLTRDIIQVPVISWSIKDGDIAYVRIYQFSGNLPEKFRNVVSEALKSNAKKMILDLRNNPGGYLEAAVDIASWFLPKGSVVLKEEFRDNENDDYRSKGYSALQNFPVVVLVNNGSASASEILAGALKDIKGVKLIGEKTFGKGSVQQVETLPDDSSLKITVAKWFTPSGISIADEGLTPDIEVQSTEDDYNHDRDPQLDKAIEVLSR
jgi:carboxyl-terminal processing protease